MFTTSKTVLEGLLTLDDEDRTCKTDLLDFHQNYYRSENFKAKLQQKIAETGNIARLIRIADNDATIEDMLLDPALDSFWQTAWRHFGTNPTPTDPELVDAETAYHDMVPEEKIATFNLIRGMFFFRGAQRYSETDNRDCLEQILLLLKAAHYNCFPAIHALIQNTFKAPNIGKKQKLMHAITLARKLSELYGTPGYMILAEAHFQLGKFKYTLNKTAVSKTLSREVEESFTSAALAALQAEQNYSASVNSINNCCLGKGLSFTNNFECDNPLELCQNIIDFANACGYELNNVVSRFSSTSNRC